MLSATLCLINIGCAAPKGSEVDPDTRRASASQGTDSVKMPTWFPHAVELRVHPASRYVWEDLDKDNGQKELVLEVRVELIDQFGEPIKDVGRFAVDLRLVDENDQMIRDTKGDPIGYDFSFEEFDVRTEASQRERWDPIARAYILPLKIDPRDADFAKQRTVLWVRFEPAWPGMPLLPTGENARKPVKIRQDW